ncbi:uncharacterized protein N7496_012362 [Penicillium cataractarum]|uniref:CENP-V/GFA domain-containing protein n=1 Tax=Penicillium cataractarum TaxID=2100454 RepID=A0A9W9UTR6_9EURO|nr:uncharacterized protein N7496_012362 [Penicillium cataractarum]KAJ5355150.1 hypothetical protein N7496_012362 [Penicillium cataractarum]
MAYVGHCNCNSVRITLQEQPAGSVICHWFVSAAPRTAFVIAFNTDIIFQYSENCRRAGGAFSVNYFVAEDEITVEDSNNAMGVYDDQNTAAGHVIQRYFCSKCGSPTYTKTPKAPGKLFLKASLFDTIAPAVKEVFEHRRLLLFQAESSDKPKSD